LSRGLTPRVAAVLVVLLLPLGASLVIRALWPEPVAPTVAAIPLDEPASPQPSADPANQTPALRGKILDSQGNPAPGANVRLITPAAPYRVLHDTTSDREGSFAFELVAGRVRVVADRDPAGFVTSAVLETTGGASKDITLVLSATSGIRGTVADAHARPIGGARITVEGMPWTVPIATSDNAGAFHQIVVPNEATAVVVQAQGYETARVPLAQRQSDVELVVPVQLRASSTNDASLGDSVPGSVEGVVLDEQGVGVPLFTIAVQGGREPAYRPHTFDDPSGAFVVDRLAPGSYVLSASAPGKPPGHTGTIDVQAGTATRGVKIFLAPSGSVVGLVFDKQHAPLPGVDLYLGTPGSPTSTTAHTDESGRFHFDFAPVGALTVRVQRAGFQTRIISGLQVRSGATLTSNVVLSPESDDAASP